MILILENVSISNSEKTIIDNISFTINEKDKIGLIGKNGIGKSTLLKAITGQIEIESGKIIYDKNKTIAYLPQVVEINDNEITVDEYVKETFKTNYISSLEETNNDLDIKSILTKLDITDLDKKMCNLSGGEKRRVMLAITLAKKADLLVLDEPTNHLDIQMVEWLEKYLIKYNKAIIMITHDRYFLDKVVNKVTELDNTHITPFTENYTKYLEYKDEQLEFQTSVNRKRKSFLRKELEWISRGAMARTTKDKRRIENYQKEKETYQLDNQVNQEKVEIDFSKTPRLGNVIIELENVKMGFNDKCLIKDLTYKVSKEDRIGIIGKNGRGKTTLLNLISGKLKQDSGTIIIGQTVKLGYFTQENENFDVDMKVFDYIESYADHIEASKLLESFLFTKEMQFMKINKLSGGEKRRLKLLKVLVTHPNVLLLDEPSNDLDIETLNVLENYIKEFLGPVIIVSHDRYFLDKCVTKIFEVTENGAINFYLGNYSDYLNKKVDNINISVEKQKQDTRIRNTSNKMTYSEKQEYSHIEDDISALENEIKDLENELNNLYTLANTKENYEKIMNISKIKEEKDNLLLSKMERWEYLMSKDN